MMASLQMEKPQYIKWSGERWKSFGKTKAVESVDTAVSEVTGGVSKEDCLTGKKRRKLTRTLKSTLDGGV